MSRRKRNKAAEKRIEKLDEGIVELGAPEEEGHREAKFSKWVVKGTAMFLLFLFMSYFLLGPMAIGIIGGFLESNTINNQNLVVEKSDKSVIFLPEVYDELVELYKSEEGNEFKACLLGKVRGSTYFVDLVHIPETFEKEFNRVVAENCPRGTVIDLHSHPGNHCTPSYQDVKVLRTLKNQDTDRIMAVMCGLERFTFYF